MGWYDDAGLTVDVVDLDDPVCGVQTQPGYHGHADQAHQQPSLLQRPGHREQRGAHHRVPYCKTENKQAFKFCVNKYL